MDRIKPKDCQVLSLGDFSGFNPIFSGLSRVMLLYVFENHFLQYIFWSFFVHRIWEGLTFFFTLIRYHARSRSRLAVTFHFIPFSLLAMIKCSICSYQWFANWYVSNCRLACHINFGWGSNAPTSHLHECVETKGVAVVYLCLCSLPPW